MTDAPLVLLAGATGDLGARIATALARNGTPFRVLLRPGQPAPAALLAAGAPPAFAAYDDPAALALACAGTSCVISALNGLAPVILDAQTRLLDAAVAAGTPRFIPSDFSLDFTRTRPGDNRNLDLRRAFMARIDAAPVRATSILNGAFLDLLAGQAPIVLRGPRRILVWGDPDQPLDFTAKDDVADYTARAALDDTAPRLLRIAGATITPRQLAALMSDLTGTEFRTLRAGGLGLLGALIRVARTVAPGRDAVFPAWQGMQYLRDMASGRGHLAPLDNDRYGPRPWTSPRDVLAP